MLASEDRERLAVAIVNSDQVQVDLSRLYGPLDRTSFYSKFPNPAGSRCYVAPVSAGIGGQIAFVAACTSKAGPRMAHEVLDCRRTREFD
jgi:hypothetical protein